MVKKLTFIIIGRISAYHKHFGALTAQSLLNHNGSYEGLKSKSNH